MFAVREWQKKIMEREGIFIRARGIMNSKGMGIKVSQCLSIKENLILEAQNILEE